MFIASEDLWVVRASGDRNEKGRKHPALLDVDMQGKKENIVAGLQQSGRQSAASGRDNRISARADGLQTQR